MKKYEKLAMEIIKYLNKHDMWFDVLIYANNKCFASNPTKKDIYEEKKIGKIVYYEREETDPKAYIEYANPKTITMSFEGPLYHAINYGTGRGHKTEEELSEIFEKYGLYYEYGYAWSLSGYPL